jgi:hypothetical protein
MFGLIVIVLVVDQYTGKNVVLLYYVLKSEENLYNIIN